MAENLADKYLLRVTAGPSYDPATHVVLPVNTPQSTLISSPHCTSRVQVRIQNYRGLPRGSPSSSPYFAHAAHTGTQYSIAFAFAPRAAVAGSDLVFGNDFDRPIRDRLPPGFGAALRIVRWAIDPGLEGDPYADRPWLYGPLLSSLNVLRVGARNGTLADGTAEERLEEVLEEGAESAEAGAWRAATGAPAGAAERQKWALGAPERAAWTWEAGRVYAADFFNGYLDFNDFSLRLPGGFTLEVLPYLGGKEDLRYVLKNKSTDEVFFVVVFTLVLKEDVEKEEAEGDAGAKAAKDSGKTAPDEQQGSRGTTSADDLD